MNPRPTSPEANELLQIIERHLTAKLEKHQRAYQLVLILDRKVQAKPEKHSQ